MLKTCLFCGGVGLAAILTGCSSLLGGDPSTAIASVNELVSNGVITAEVGQSMIDALQGKADLLAEGLKWGGSVLASAGSALGLTWKLRGSPHERKGAVPKVAG